MDPPIPTFAFDFHRRCPLDEGRRMAIMAQNRSFGDSPGRALAKR